MKPSTLTRAAAPFAVALWTCAASLAAQERVEQAVVVTAAATPVQLSSVTRTFTVITREQVRMLPASSVADVLRLIASVDVRSRGDRGMQSDFSIRGASFGQALVLVDGVRLNDPQTGHHNGDIPVPLDMVERIEILRGSGSSLFGADAVGGTINVITRNDITSASGRLEGGSFGLLASGAQFGVGTRRVRQTVAAEASRSAGFMDEREFATASLSTRISVRERADLFVGYLWKDFGANGFYGNSPSHESTNQTLMGLDQRLGEWGGWRVAGNASYRTHGDRFLWDARRPGVSENIHRTHVVVASVKASRDIRKGSSFAAGLETGADWIRSNNLGRRSNVRASVFGEWREAIGTATYVDGSLRLDRYSEFGAAWSPSLGIGWWPSAAVRLRASVGRAFRVPTFTERYYSDPAHLARAELRPETARSAEIGADAFGVRGLTVSATLFSRFERDAIDWLRPTAADRWQTYNIRDVGTIGVELGARRTLPGGGLVHAEYTGLSVRAGGVSQLSKYVLDYAPHGVAVSAIVPLPGKLQFAPRAGYRRRTRPSGSSEYVVIDVRLTRRIGRFELRVDGSNLLDASYEEVLGVTAPSRAATLSAAVGLP